jgi:hypothetical protein
MTRRVLLCALLVGCGLGPDERLERPSERAAIEALREVVSTVPCESIEPGHVVIREAPQREIARYCSGGRWETGTVACVHGSYHNGAFTDGTEMHVSWDSGWNVHHNLIQHEAMHQLLGCLLGHTDRRHRDPRWTSGHMQRARERFLVDWPAPEDPADDPYTRIPRRPWDLTGTRWEGQDCEVQPLAWIADGLVPGCEPPGMDGGP